MHGKPLRQPGVEPPCTGSGMLEELRKSRADYAAHRMSQAIKRMGDTSLSSGEWESALKWATVWGMATRMCSRCRSTDMCTYPTCACGLDKDDRPNPGI